MMSGSMSKAVYVKSTAITILNGGKMSSSSTEVSHERGMSLSPFLFSTVLTALAGAVKLEKVIKRGQMWKDEAKLSRFADDMTLYLNDQKILSKNF